MFEEKPEKLNEQKPADPIDALSEILERVQNRPLLQKIEKNTAVLPALLRALTITKGVKAAHMYVTTRTGQPVKPPAPAKRAFAERARDEHGRFAATTQPVATPTSTPRVKAALPAVTAPAPHVREVQAAETATTATVPVREVPSTSAVAPPTTVLPAPVTPSPLITPQRPPRMPHVVATATETPERQREQNGRFRSAGERERDRQREEGQAKGLKGFLKNALGAVFSKGKEHGGDIEEAAGKAVGGPIYESAKEMYGAVGELREKLQDEKTLLGQSFKWFKGTKAGNWLGKKAGLTGRSAPPTEGAEERRHRELLDAVNGQHGGGSGGGGGVSDLVEGGIAGGLGYKLLKKIPGASAAGKILAKAGPALGALLSAPVLAGTAAVLATGALAAGLGTLISSGVNKVTQWATGGQSGSAGEWIYDKTHPAGGEDKGFQQRYQQYSGDVKDAAARNGVSEDYMKTMMKIESGGVNNAVSSTGAKGLYQFTSGTAKGYGIGGREFDPKANIDAAARLARDNAADMQKRGIAVNDSNLYLAHQLGVGGEGKGGLKDLLAAKESGQVSPALRKQMDLNGGKGMDAKQYLSMWRDKYSKEAIEAGADPNAMARAGGAKVPASVAVAQGPSTAPGTVKAAGGMNPQKVAPARQEVREVTQPAPLQDLAPAPVTATLMGADKLVAALKQQQNAPRRESAAAPPIRTHYDDTLVNLMAHDRI